MPEPMHLLAASVADVVDLLGVGRRDPVVGRAVLARMAGWYTEQPLDDVSLDAVGAHLLWGDAEAPLPAPVDPALGSAGGPDDWAALVAARPDASWHGLEALVGVCCLASARLPGIEAVRDIDDAFAELGLPEDQRPLRLSRHVEDLTPLPLPEREFLDARVLPAATADQLWRSWLAAGADSHAELTAFARAWSQVQDEADGLGRRPVDLWLFAPGLPGPDPSPEPTPWPPTTAPDRGPDGPLVAALVDDLG